MKVVNDRTLDSVPDAVANTVIASGLVVIGRIL